MPRKPEEAPAEGDYGTVESRRQAFYIVEQPDDRDRSSRRVRVESDMPTWYERRGYLTTPQADALRKWQADAYLAGLIPPMIGNYQQAISGRVQDVSDVRMAAQTRRNHAMAFLMGSGIPDGVAIVEAVAVEGKSAGRYMLQRSGMSPNEALELLVRCAVSLARHYGLMK